MRPPGPDQAGAGKVRWTAAHKLGIGAWDRACIPSFARQRLACSISRWRPSHLVACDKEAYRSVSATPLVKVWKDWQAAGRASSVLH